jgi:predicted CXXCH cytochrome family protein
MKPKSFRKIEIIKIAVTSSALLIAFLVTFGSSKGLFSARLMSDAVLANGETQSEKIKDDMVCLTCHEQVVKDFAKTVHGKAPSKWELSDTSKNAEYASAQTCNACHGDPTEHINSGGDKTKIKNPAKLDQKESVASCQSCHSQVNEHAQWRGSRHESSGLTCVSCHSPHHPAGQKPGGGTILGVKFADVKAETKLLKFRSEADTCYSCHTDVRKSMFQRSTHLFRNEDLEQRISCSTCHEPHGSIGEKMTRTGSVNETCYTCHAEYQGPFLFEHAPVRESCANCHKPHGSNNINLLKQRAPMLCQQCHIQGRHQTVPGRSNSAFNINRSCTNCHSQVHGSNHPSGINLQR